MDWPVVGWGHHGLEEDQNYNLGFGANPRHECCELRYDPFRPVPSACSLFLGTKKCIFVRYCPFFFLILVLQGLAGR